MLAVKMKKKKTDIGILNLGVVVTQTESPIDWYQIHCGMQKVTSSLRRDRGYLSLDGIVVETGGGGVTADCGGGVGGGGGVVGRRRH